MRARAERFGRAGRFGAAAGLVRARVVVWKPMRVLLFVRARVVVALRDAGCAARDARRGWSPMPFMIRSGEAVFGPHQTTMRLPWNVDHVPGWPQHLPLRQE